MTVLDSMADIHNPTGKNTIMEVDPLAEPEVEVWEGMIDAPLEAVAVVDEETDPEEAAALPTWALEFITFVVLDCSVHATPPKT